MGKPVTITLDHDLGIAGARQRIDEQFDSLKESITGNMMLKFDRHWEGDRMSFTARGMGQKVSGDIDIFPKHVRIVIILPTILASMAEAVKGRVEKKGQILLEDKSKAKT
ncbi:polyhydroxyalkanoic acid system family protein [Parvularcula sp. LCG005]|uniref:polyhydroxyalkanoic acid system family protein n=1 Tax=Parvularcula sp. LCG005 TaxID=3078805 RepID=UPI00294221B3|nr:polyhydroxyalkanoic acid system family protein [Parvularcula sp. LCG005]WOI52365.1 polyhydroxyalkanoic acid system family protein [Parvularcula sp. LCG005]